MKKILFISLLIFSASLFATTITAKRNGVCCPTKQETSDASLLSDGTSLMRYTYQHECTLMSVGTSTERIGSSFTMVQILDFYGKFWCAREVFE